jgi:hypothetical protein
LVFLQELFLALLVIRVFGDAVHGTDLNALRLLKMSHAFGALGGINFVDLLAKINGLIGTLGLAHIAVDALLSDHQSHG